MRPDHERNTMPLPKADTSELVYLAEIAASLARIEAALAPAPPAPAPAPPPAKRTNSRP